MTKTKTSEAIIETPIQIVKSEKDRNKEVLEKFEKEESKLVKGRFRCFETPGATIRIQQKKYKNLPFFDKYMMDGEIYEVPLWVARWLNGVDITATAIDGKIGSCSYPVHGFKWNPGTAMPTSSMGAGPNGEGGIPVPIVGVAKRTRRYGFESLDFDASI